MHLIYIIYLGCLGDMFSKLDPISQLSQWFGTITTVLLSSFRSRYFLSTIASIQLSRPLGTLGSMGWVALKWVIDPLDYVVCL